jgi:hypothetical protein
MTDSPNFIYYKMAGPEVLMPAPTHLVKIMTMSTCEEIGVFVFDRFDDAKLHHEEYRYLRGWIHEADLSFDNSDIHEDTYGDLNLMWVLMVNAFTDKWGQYLVPFDIRDEYNYRNEDLGGQAQQVRIWPEKVEVEAGIDFDIRLIELIRFEAAITMYLNPY